MKRIVILLVLSVLSVRSEEPANNRALLDKLRADDFDERLDARAKLIARGSAVRELVTRELARTDLDADYKTNLKAVAAGLSEGVALEPFDAPKRLDFEARGETVAKALEIISQQYGQIVTARGNAGSKRVTVSIKRATFIEVVNAVRENAGLNFFPNMDIAKPKVDVVRGGTTEDFANLALCEPPEGVNGIVATSGPFAIVLNQAVMGVGIGDPVLYRNLNISGYIYYGTDVKLSKMKITALKASTSDNKQTFDLVAPNVSKAQVQFYRIRTGTAVDSTSFFTRFTGSVRVRGDEDLPSNLNWAFKLALEVPLITLGTRIGVPALGFKKTAGTQDEGLLVVYSVEYISKYYCLHVSIPGDQYMSNPAKTRDIPWIIESTPLGMGNWNRGVRFFDEAGALLPWRVSRGDSNRDQSVFFAHICLDSLPKTMTFSQTTKSAIREFDFEFPAVPVPLNPPEEK